MTNPTIGRRLIVFRERSKLSLAAVAEAAGYKAPSSVQRFFDEGYAPEVLPLPVARRLAKALAGKGQPPIFESEILELAGVVPEYAAGLSELRHRRYERESIIAVHPTFQAQEIDHFSGIYGVFYASPAITSAAYERPEALRWTEVGGIIMMSDTMSPRYLPGELVVYDSSTPAQIGDHVYISLRAGRSAGKIPVLIARLTGRLSDALQLEQYSPPRRFDVQVSEAATVYRVVPTSGLLTPTSFNTREA